MMYSADETCDLGIDNGSNVSDDYTPQTSRFNEVINWVQLDAGARDERRGKAMPQGAPEASGKTSRKP